MPRIVETKTFNGAAERIRRLGLGGLFSEIETILSGFELLVREEKDSNGGAAVRDLLDSRFVSTEGWIKTQSGGVDWVKCIERLEARLCVGVEVQVSSRSDLLIVDVCHLRDMIEAGDLDVGVLVVPSDHLGSYLTDRAPKYSDALTAVSRARADDLPLIVIALEHDGPGKALEKRRTRQGRKTQDP